jgi:hypothetical protein
MPAGRERWLLCFLLCCAVRLHGSMTLFVEEPYGPFGALSPTGHAAIYLSSVCAETPTSLRHCRAGESGVVISRYSHIHGYDWIAIPLIPYLYAVDEPDKVLEWSDPKAVSHLRQTYRNRYLSDLVVDDSRSGAWTQLVGASYDRRIYGLQIETTQEQDDQVIQELNSKPNRSHFNFFFHNCADFARKIIDLNHPKSVRRSFSADLGFTTPKQIAKCLVTYGKLHPDLKLSTFVIPQIPGELARSHKVRGVCEALVRSKKYVVPLVFLNPWVTAGFFAGYMTGGRFNLTHSSPSIAVAPQEPRELTSWLDAHQSGQSDSVVSLRAKSDKSVE